MRFRWSFAIAATAAAPVALRVAALADRAGGFSLGDLRGFGSDVAVALLAVGALWVLGRAGRIVVAAAAVVWTLGHYANYEFVVAQGAAASVRDLHYLFDPTFVSGSALAISRPLLLALLVAGVTGLATAGARASARSVVACVVGGVGLAIGIGALPTDPASPGWREVDFLQRDLAGALSALAGSEVAVPDADPPEAMLAALPGLRADLEGTPLFPPASRPLNVLLVVLESVSGIHLESFAAEHGREPNVDMPALDAFARRNLRYTSFVAHQRKTNRGLYALLCGELPNLTESTPKMSEAAFAPWRVCLPEVLREAGYRTVYLQGAPLAFMLKDRFLPRAGFDVVHGEEWFTSSYVQSAWGVDDRAFFEQARRFVEEVDDAPGPWFATLLTVGTHHPFLLPDEPGAPKSFRRAAARLDAAFGAFMAWLEASDRLDDTLLVVTSDESLGFTGFRTEPLFKGTSQSWGFLVVRPPEPREGVVRAPFGLVDLPLSILDHLGLAERGTHFFGRSVFRRYDTGRDLVFANVNTRRLGALEARGSLLLCGEEPGCRRYPVEGDRWFATLREPSVVPAADAAWLRDLARSSAPGRGARAERFALVEPGRDVRLEDERAHMLHGGQYLRVASDEWLEVEYEVSVTGDSGTVEIVHGLTGEKNAPILRRRAVLKPGERLRIRYTYAPDGPRAQLQCRTLVRREGSAPLVLHHGSAELRIRRGAGRPAAGAQVAAFEFGDA